MWNYNPNEYWRCPEPDHVCMFDELPVDPVCYAEVVKHYCCPGCERVNPVTIDGFTVCCGYTPRAVRGRCGKELIYVKGSYLT